MSMSSEFVFPSIHQLTVERMDRLKQILLTGQNGSLKINLMLKLTKVLAEYINADNGFSSRGSRIPDIPKLLLQVDMFHAIAHIMVSSDTKLFEYYCPPLEADKVDCLQEKVTLVVEAGLRVAVITSNYCAIATARKFFLQILKRLSSVPPSIQHQIIATFKTLPESLELTELAKWIEFLWFCHCPDFLPWLEEYYEGIQRHWGKYADGSDAFVKVVLSLSQAMMQCGISSYRGTQLFAQTVKKLHGFRQIETIGPYLGSLYSFLQRGKNTDLSPYFQSAEFIHLLSNLLSNPCVSSVNEFDESLYAYEIAYLFLTQSSSNSNAWEYRKTQPCRIMLKLESVIQLLKHYTLSDAVLKVLTESLKTNLKSRLLEVEERTSEELGTLLTIIHFLSLGLVHRAISVESQKIVWEFLSELFSFSVRPKGQVLQAHGLELSPWNRLTVTSLISPNEPLTSSPLEFWNFILKWMELLTVHKKMLRISSTDLHSLGSFVHVLHSRIIKEVITEDSGSLGYFSHSQPKESQDEKLSVLKKIANICLKITDDSIAQDQTETNHVFLEQTIETTFNEIRMESFDVDDDDGDDENENMEFDAESQSISVTSETVSESHFRDLL